MSLELLRDGKDPVVDIVAVHGLNGDPFETWTSPKNKKLWLKDDNFIHGSLQRARVMSFGYNANLFSDVVTSRVYDHSKMLLDELRLARSSLPEPKAGSRNRPIIFIGHSLGGIVIKLALISASSLDNYKAILQDTFAIFFLGTPHNGADLAANVQVAQRLVAFAKLRNAASTNLTKELEPYSQRTKEINGQFKDIAKGFQIVTFYEQKETLTHLGWTLIVPDGSAIMNHPSEIDIPADANHQDICKFETPEDKRFIKLHQRIAEKIDVIIRVDEKSNAELRAREQKERDEAQRKVEEEEHRANEDPRLKELPAIPSSILGRSNTSSILKDSNQPLTYEEKAVSEAFPKLPKSELMAKPPIMASLWTAEEQSGFLELLSNLTANLRGPGSERPQEGTCEWIIQHNTFSRWSTSKEGGILFLLGPSGCGKTVLSNFVSKRLKREGSFVVPFYCKDARGKDRIPPVVETFIYRLLTEDRRLFAHVPPKYKWKKFPNSSDPPWKLEEAWEIFESILEDTEAPKSYFFLDGLDECNELFVNGLLKHLESAFGPTSNNMARKAGVGKIMLTCRPRWNIPDCASRFSLLDVGLEDDEDGGARFVSEDIERFVREELRKVSQARNYSDDLKNSIQEKILLKANGMFLWVSLVLEKLRNGRYQANRITVERIVDTFPTDMNRYYSETLESILATSLTEFKEILKIVLYAMRPLTSRELAVALAITSNPKSTDELENFVDHGINNWVTYNTGGLLKINGDTCDIVHFSFREFLESISRNERIVHLRHFRLNRDISHLDMARRCINFLMLEDFQDILELSRTKRARILESRAFLVYAINYWPLHVKLAGDLIDLENELLTEFLRPDGSFYPCWDTLYREQNGRINNGNQTPLLHYIAEFGLMNLLIRVTLLRCAGPTDTFQQRTNFFFWRKWIRFKHKLMGNRMIPLKFDIDETDDSMLSAIDYACMAGELGIVDHLLRAGAWPYGTYSGYYTPFQIALQAGFQDVALRIIEKGPRVDEPNRVDNMARPIHYACASGLFLMVYLIYSTGRVDLDEPKSTGETPLYLAIENDHPAVVAFLLYHHASPNPHTLKGPYPLHVAIRRGNLDIVSMLLESEVEVNVYDENGMAPIHWAAASDRADIVRLLKNRDANIDLVAKSTTVDVDEYHGYDKWNALHIAVQEGRPSTIKALVDCGADIGAKNKDGSTALGLVAVEGDEEAADILLNAGSPLNEPNLGGHTPLYNATVNNHLTIVRSLLNRGADPDIAPPSSKISALHIAAWDNKVDIMKELLQKSANVEARTIIPAGWTPLFPAAWKGNSEAVKVLIDFDANPRAVTPDGARTVLETAVSAGNYDTVKMLIENGATVRHGLAKRFTALHAASIDGRADIVETILDHEKDAVNLETETGATPFFSACCAGHDKVAEMLLASGANPKVVGHSGITAFHAVVGNCKLPLVKQMMKHYPDIELKTTEGLRPIHFACLGGRLQNVEELLRAGADIRQPVEGKSREAGVTPLHQAANGGSTAVVDFILSTGEEANIQDNSGLTPLHYASSGGFAKTVKLLLEHHANFKIQDHNGDTCLHYAAWEGCISTSDVLIDNGAYINQINNNGETAINIAIQRFALPLVTLLLKRGARIDIENSYGETTFDMALAQFQFSKEALDAVQQRTFRTRRNKLLDGVLYKARAIKRASYPQRLGFSPIYHSLRRLHNYKDLQCCMEFAIEVLIDGSLQHNAFCNICRPAGSTSALIIGYRYNCMLCPNMDLCEIHMKQYESQVDRKTKICAGHSFLCIPEDLLKFDKERHKAFGYEHQVEWLEEIEYLYAWERWVSPEHDLEKFDVDWPVFTDWLISRTKNHGGFSFRFSHRIDSSTKVGSSICSATAVGLPRFAALFYQEFNAAVLASRFCQRLLL